MNKNDGKVPGNLEFKNVDVDANANVLSLKGC